MTFVGKLLVIVQLVLSLCFMALAGAVFTRHQSWKDVAEQRQEAVEAANDDLQKMQAEKDKIIDDLETSVARLENDLNDAQSELALEEEKVANLEVEIDRQKTELNTQEALATIAGDEARIRREEALAGRRINEQLNQALNEQNQKVRQLEDELFNSEVELESVSEKYSGLLKTVAAYQRVLAANGFETDPRKYRGKLEPVPLVVGRVLETKKAGRGIGRELIEISIGSDDGLSKGNTLHVYRTGEQNKYLGEIRLELVTPDKAVGVVVNRAKNGVIEREDYVTTRL